MILLGCASRRNISDECRNGRPKRPKLALASSVPEPQSTLEAFPADYKTPQINALAADF
jgi:hypothetical protein